MGTNETLSWMEVSLQDVMLFEGSLRGSKVLQRSQINLLPNQNRKIRLLNGNQNEKILFNAIFSWDWDS